MRMYSIVQLTSEIPIPRWVRVPRAYRDYLSEPYETEAEALAEAKARGLTGCLDYSEYTVPGGVVANASTYLIEAAEWEPDGDGGFSFVGPMCDYSELPEVWP